jgi:hypothetical protein
LPATSILEAPHFSHDYASWLCDSELGFVCEGDSDDLRVTMKNGGWLGLLLGGIIWGVLVSTPGLPLPAGDKLGFGGSASAQPYIEIDYFYDELEPYGQWVWHPRFGYVWLPETVSPYWRPYTVGHWVSTDEYGWYWTSYEPFAWAVYHYGRWGYDPDYGWFWVPGDTWAPAWVQWRYSDHYIGWAPIGPGPHGYAYGMPINYEPPIAESWVFVQPRYMTSRAVFHYAVPVSGLSVVFLGATNVYRPQFRGGVVYNYGIPRDRVVKIIRRPIVVQKIYKIDRKGGDFKMAYGRGRGINVYAPSLAKGAQPQRGPRKFADHPDQFKAKAKLKDTFEGELPKGWGQSAKAMTPIVKEVGPDGFKRKRARFDGPGDNLGDNDKGQAAKGSFGVPGRDKVKDNDKDKGQAATGIGDDQGDQGKDKDQSFDGSGVRRKAAAPPDQGGSGEQAIGEEDKKGKKRKGYGALGGPDGPPSKQGKGGQAKWKGPRGPGAPGEFGGPGRPKAFDGPGGPGGPEKRKQAEEGQGSGKGHKKDKCTKNPEHPSCRD